jgi:hypothetical protein
VKQTYSLKSRTSEPHLTIIVALSVDDQHGGSSGQIVVNSRFSWSNSDQLVVQVVE